MALLAGVSSKPGSPALRFTASAVALPDEPVNPSVGFSRLLRRLEDGNGPLALSLHSAFWETACRWPVSLLSLLFQPAVSLCLFYSEWCESAYEIRVGLGRGLRACVRALSGRGGLTVSCFDLISR